MSGRATELELDHYFWQGISDNRLFREWFLALTKFADLDLELVANEKWHQRWYRDQETGKESETDILLMPRDNQKNKRYAIHIENKPDHGIWREDQAANYRKRAINQMIPWRYVDFQIVLIAPISFIARCPEEVGHFDVVVSYEDISLFIPQFSVNTTKQLARNPRPSVSN
jgi:hypothetical protein